MMPMKSNRTRTVASTATMKAIAGFLLFFQATIIPAAHSMVLFSAKGRENRVDTERPQVRSRNVIDRDAWASGNKGKDEDKNVAEKIEEGKAFDDSLDSLEAEEDSRNLQQIQYPIKKPTIIFKKPSAAPSEEPSESPSAMPSPSPSEEPSESPSAMPSPSPSSVPSESPSAMPSPSPSEEPSESPSAMPSPSPSDEPSESPSDMPSPSPTKGCVAKPLCNWQEECDCSIYERYSGGKKGEGIFNAVYNNSAVTYLDMSTCVCHTLQNECPDRCAMAEQEYLALLLNIASGHLRTDCVVETYCQDDVKGLTTLTTVQDQLDVIDKFMSAVPHSDYLCTKAMLLASRINGGKY